MSASIFLQQRPEAAYLLTDAAQYYADGMIESFCDKCEAFPTAHCALTVLGPALWHPIIAEAISEFDSYDALKAGIEPLTRELFAQHADSIRWKLKGAELWIVGWSQAQARVEAFTVNLCDEAEWQIWLERGATESRAPFRPDVQRTWINANPAPTAAALHEARFPTDEREYVPEVDLVHLIEVLRRTPLSHQEWPWLVGGFATLTTVDATGVTQRKVHEWPEDRVGERIQPRPLNWAKWRIEREAAVAGTPLSRLQADRLARREAKVRRRALA